MCHCMGLHEENPARTLKQRLLWRPAGAEKFFKASLRAQS